ANDAYHSRLGRHPARRGARNLALHDRATDLSRPAWHVGGLIETVGSVGAVINNLKVGGDANATFDSLREGLAAPLSGMGISFSSSLFGLAGSLVLGFLDLQMSQAQNRFHTDLEDWLATTVHDLGGATDVDAIAGGGGSGEMRVAIERLREAITGSGSNKAATNAMANL